jgi:excisionase family DNA binding protein
MNNPQNPQGRDPAFLNLYPRVAQELGLSRAATYKAARRGEIPTVKFGRLRKVPLSWLRQHRGE